MKNKYSVGTKLKKVIIVAGARPNFMKVAPILVEFFRGTLVWRRNVTFQSFQDWAAVAVVATGAPVSARCVDDLEGRRAINRRSSTYSGLSPAVAASGALLRAASGDRAFGGP